MWEYTDKVKEHFLNPRNVGEVENPDGVAEVLIRLPVDIWQRNHMLFLKILNRTD